MRKSILALAAAGSVFALTAAAASTLQVTGAFNPQAGTGTAIECDPGNTTVATVNDGVSITGFTVTATASTLKTSCENAFMWVKVPFTRTVGVPTTGTYFMRITANDDYAGSPVTFEFATEAGTIFPDKDKAAATGTRIGFLPVQAINDTKLGSASILVTNTDAVPLNF